MKTILAFSGSSRRGTFDPSIENPFARGSFNTALLKAFVAQAPEGVTIEHVEFKDLPMYDQDLESEFPKAVSDLKAKIRAADGIIIVTPEYNRSIPAYLKNMIDWTSRPYGDSAWAGKPIYIAGATGGSVGTALAQYHLKQVMNYLDTRVLGQPEFYLSGAHEKFDANGVLTDEQTKGAIEKALATFTKFIG